MLGKLAMLQRSRVCLGKDTLEKSLQVLKPGGKLITMSGRSVPLLPGR